MSGGEGFDVNLEGELSSRHLLALVLEVECITEKAAIRKLGVDSELVGEWIKELRREGLIEVEESTGYRALRVTSTGLKKLKDIQKEWYPDEGEKKPSSEKSMKRMGVKFKSFPKTVSSKLKEVWMDLVIVFVTLFAVYLLKLFFDNPDVEVLSFFFGTLFLSVTLILYSQYKKYLKTRKFIGFIQWLSQLADSKKKYIATTLMGVVIIYVAVMLMLNPQNKSFYFILAVVAASTVALSVP